MKDLLTGFDGSRCWASNRVWLTINESRHFDDVRGVELSQEMRDARSSSIAVSQGLIRWRDLEPYRLEPVEVFNVSSVSFCGRQLSEALCFAGDFAPADVFTVALVDLDGVRTLRLYRYPFELWLPQILEAVEGEAFPVRRVAS